MPVPPVSIPGPLDLHENPIRRAGSVETAAAPITPTHVMVTAADPASSCQTLGNRSMGDFAGDMLAILGPGLSPQRFDLTFSGTDESRRIQIDVGPAGSPVPAIMADIWIPSLAEGGQHVMGSPVVQDAAGRHYWRLYSQTYYNTATVVMRRAV